MYSPNLCCYSRSSSVTPWCWYESSHSITKSHHHCVCTQYSQCTAASLGQRSFCTLGRCLQGFKKAPCVLSQLFSLLPERSRCPLPAELSLSVGQPVLFRPGGGCTFGTEDRTSAQATRYGEVLLVGKVRTSGARLVVPSSIRRQKSPIPRGRPHPELACCLSAENISKQSGNK